MRGFPRLLAHSLKRVRTLVLAGAILLGAFQVILILVARSVQTSNAFDQMGALIPPFVRELLGPAVTSLMSFNGMVCLGYFHLVVMSSLVALVIALATMPASEIESGFMDLILSRPLARYWIITRSIAVLIICSAALLITMLAGTWGGLNTLAPKDIPWPERKLVLSLAINLGVLMLCWGGIALAIGSVARRRSVAGALAGLLAVAMFLLDYVARAWRTVEPAGWFSPFRYYSPFDLLMGNPLPVKNLVVLASIAVTGFALAYLLFSRRDISH